MSRKTKHVCSPHATARRAAAGVPGTGGPRSLYRVHPQRARAGSGSGAPRARPAAPRPSCCAGAWRSATRSWSGPQGRPTRSAATACAPAACKRRGRPQLAQTAQTAADDRSSPRSAQTAARAQAPTMIGTMGAALRDALYAQWAAAPPGQRCVRGRRASGAVASVRCACAAWTTSKRAARDHKRARAALRLRARPSRSRARRASAELRLSVQVQT